jgi:hypothetical protein
MADPFVWLSPGDPSDTNARLRCLNDFWEQLAVGGSAGGTTWEALEEIRSEVEKSLRRVPMDIGRAESLTAYAAFLMTGPIDS